MFSMTKKTAALGLTLTLVLSMAFAATAQAVPSKFWGVVPQTNLGNEQFQRLGAGGDYDATRAAFIARQPIGRIGKAEEIADLVVYLAGATYTTGQVQIIDGGWSI